MAMSPLMGKRQAKAVKMAHKHMSLTVKRLGQMRQAGAQEPSEMHTTIIVITK